MLRLGTEEELGSVLMGFLRCTLNPRTLEPEVHADEFLGGLIGGFRLPFQGVGLSEV